MNSAMSKVDWNFNCPQFVDFTSGPTADDDADRYFDYDHENGIPVDDELADGCKTPQQKTRRNNRIKAATPLSAAKVGTPQRVPRSKTPGKENDTPNRVTRSAKAVPKEQKPDVEEEAKEKTEVDPALQVMNHSQTGSTKTAADDEISSPKNEVRRTTRSMASTPQTVEKTTTPKRATRSVTIESPAPEPAVAVETPVEQGAEEDKECIRPPNLCVDLEEWRRKTKGARVVNNAQTRRSAVPKSQTEQKTTIKRQNKSLDRPVDSPKKPKLAPAVEAAVPAKGASALQRSRSFAAPRNRPSDSTSATRKHTRGLSSDRTVKAANSATNESRETPTKEVRSRSQSATKHTRGRSTDRSTSSTTSTTTSTTTETRKHKLTEPNGVPVIKKQLLTSEELELKKISSLREELDKKRKLNEESCRAALQGTGRKVCVPAAPKEPTVPHEFHFSTDSRVKAHTAETKPEGDVKDFARTLRSGTQMTKSTTKHRITKAEPFHFSEQKKKDEPQGSKFVSMAQQVSAFTGTPDRFRSKPRAPQIGRPKAPSHGITIPKTPQFETKTRRRPNNAPTKEELEAKEYEESQKHQFKANPVNQKIFKNPNCGVKKVPRKPATVPEAFHLSSDNRHKNNNSQQEEEHFEFHAQPLNKKILEGTVGVKEPKKLPITVPETPDFALKHRARITSHEDEKVEKPSYRARNVPHFGIPFQPRIDHKVTEPEPFGFEERDKKRAAAKAEKIEQVIDEENRQREFYAQPLPSFEPNLPAKKPLPLTQHQPFNLATEIRGEKKAEEWGHKLEEELRQQKEMAKFKAAKATVLDAEPFVPAKEHKHTTDISEFELNTAKRTVKREAFEMHKKAKQDEIDNIRRQEELMREAEERAEVERLRREAVPKAQPIRNYKGLSIQHSDKPLTNPQSPHFQTDSRLRLRATLHSDSMSSTTSS